MPKDVFKQVGFHPIIEKWFKDRFPSPSPPQQHGWPSIAGSQHTLILAPTGSGKTLAAFLWSIDQLFCQSLKPNNQEFDKNVSGIHTLYISPLKALNNDIHQNLKIPLKEIHQLALGNDIDPPQIKVALRTGDTPPHVRRSMLRKPPHILITTPESFYLLLTSKPGRELFRTLQYVIVDEIHAVCNNKRGVHLSLSLERMTVLCQKEPIRIGLSATQKPLIRIAAYLGGQHYQSSKNIYMPREVNIIDCGQRRDMDLKVLTPVTSFSELPESSVWKPAYRKLYELIREHQTTLVFAGMRSQTEKIARELNQLHRHITGDPTAELALAHHGSISREARYSIESRLKAGTIPAVIATASLELGIDIGSIDLVVHLESPRSVSAALQRVGRSGHLLSATAKGRVVVLYPADLDDAVAIAQCMHRADIEKTHIPENALDVLAQQIVAEVAMQEWPYKELYHLMRQSYCYRRLSTSLFKNVVDMLSGRFSDTPLQALKARLNWDRVNQRLIARRGSRQVAVLNSGTIPDRGYFGVYLEGTAVRLGEVEEEFAFESRVGEVFFLGNSEWLIKQITPDRIIVSPVAAINPRAPFWKGDIQHRDYATSRKIGKFRRDLVEKIDGGEALSWLQEKYYADENTANNLIRYFIRQQKRGRCIATDSRLVGEWTIDSGGEPLLILHAPLGARVNGAWAIALAAALKQHYHTQTQYSFDDDGILIRLPDTAEPPPFDWLFKLSAPKIEDFLLAALPETPVFLVHFRYNAARSLMLPRSHPGKRIPLWLQRLRASDLLQVVSTQSDFPIIIETFRECLQDVFDVIALKRIIRALGNNTIRLDLVETSIPSPMAAGILFKFVSVHLYEEDQNRQTREGVAVSSILLDDILERQRIPTIVTTAEVEQAERQWQHLDPQYQAAVREDLFTIIEKLQPIAEEDLKRRCKGDIAGWLEELQTANRIYAVGSPVGDKTRCLWAVMEKNGERSGPDIPGESVQRAQRYLQARGPVTSAEMVRDLRLSTPQITNALEHLQQQKRVVCGALVRGVDEEQWCDRYNFKQLYRMAVARRRAAHQPADRAGFIRFLLKWHRLSTPGQPLKDIIHRYRGFRFPLYFFEREIIGHRLFDSVAETKFKSKLSEFEQLISDGEIIVYAGKTSDTGNRYIEFCMRGEGQLITDRNARQSRPERLGASAEAVLGFLQQNGASYGRDLEWGTGLRPSELNRALQELAQRGLASCENYQSLLLILRPSITSPDAGTKLNSAGGGLKHSPPGSRRQRVKKSHIRKMIRHHSRIKDGRWFLTTSPAVMGSPMNDQLQAEMQARMLLHRYGILVKECYRREHGLLPWYRIFQVLKRLEWRGEIRRGYFVSGLSGIQFATLEAVELLERLIRAPSSPEPNPILLSTFDPALPHGGGIGWDLLDSLGNPLKVTRTPTNHVVILDGNIIMYCENFFRRLWVLTDLTPLMLKAIASKLQHYLKLPHLIRPRNRIEIHQINNRPAGHSPFADQLIHTGFEKEGNTLVFWPSAF